MATNLTPQAQRSQEKKQQIYITAMRMFRDKGYNQTTIRDICAVAGITTGTFYNFFGDKFGIIQEHYRRRIQERVHILEFTAEKLDNPYQSICDYFSALSAVPSYLGKELFREFNFRTPQMLAGVTDGEHGNGIHHIALFLSKAQDRGAIPTDLNPWHTAEYLVAGYMGIMQYWLNFSAGETMDELTRRMLPVLFSAVTDQPVAIRE